MHGKFNCITLDSPVSHKKQNTFICTNAWSLELNSYVYPSKGNNTFKFAFLCIFYILIEFNMLQLFKKFDVFEWKAFTHLKLKGAMKRGTFKVINLTYLHVLRAGMVYMAMVRRDHRYVHAP